MFFENTPCERPHLEPSGVTLLARFYEGDAPHRLRWEARRYSPILHISQIHFEEKQPLAPENASALGAKC
jgi:hypothetical protein